MSRRPRLVVVGAGAAGCMAAIFAARRLGDRAEVRLLEATPDGGRKILVSGGGRCNLLPSIQREADFVSDSPAHRVRRLLRAWPLREQRRFFEDELHIPLCLEEDTGKLFPASNRARDVRDALFSEVERSGVRVQRGAKVVALEVEDAVPRLRLADGEILEAARVILACGGLSLPGTGSEGFALRVAVERGHELVAPYPALTPLRTADVEHHALAGISLDVVLVVGRGAKRRRYEGGFLFTHRGYSGPAILDASHHFTRIAAAQEAPPLRIDWTGRGAAFWSARWGADPRRRSSTALREAVPERLARLLLHRSGVDPGARMGELGRRARQALLEALTAAPLPCTGHEGYRKAEVTGGGVRLEEVDSRCLESLRCPRLHFCGETLDAFGPIGGYNFQWAWSTGRSAGEGAAAALAAESAVD